MLPHRVPDVITFRELGLKCRRVEVHSKALL